MCDMHCQLSTIPYHPHLKIWIPNINDLETMQKVTTASFDWWTIL